MFYNRYNLYALPHSNLSKNKQQHMNIRVKQHNHNCAKTQNLITWGYTSFSILVVLLSSFALFTHKVSIVILYSIRINVIAYSNPQKHIATNTHLYSAAIVHHVNMLTKLSHREYESVFTSCTSLKSYISVVHINSGVVQ
jgi:hypothetical protein